MIKTTFWFPKRKPSRYNVNQFRQLLNTRYVQSLYCIRKKQQGEFKLKSEAWSDRGNKYQ